jgi:hypothetical protein
LLTTVKGELEIIPYSQFEETDSTEKNTFYKTTTLLSYRNNGNVEKTETVSYPTSFPATLFTHTEPKAQLTKSDGKSYMSWELNLGPDEIREVKVVVDYLPL